MAFEFLSNGYYDKKRALYYIDFKDDESVDELSTKFQ